LVRCSALRAGWLVAAAASLCDRDHSASGGAVQLLEQPAVIWVLLRRLAALRHHLWGKGVCGCVPWHIGCAGRSAQSWRRARQGAHTVCVSQCAWTQRGALCVHACCMRVKATPPAS
jgi:hypothetical protein